MALVGLLMVVGGKQQGLHIGFDTLIGGILCFGSSVTWAMYYTLYVSPLSKHYSPHKATTIIMAIGAVPLLVLALPELANQDWSRVTARG